MKTLACLLLSFFILAPLSARAIGSVTAHALGPVITVERMTCKQSQSYVRRYRMYWKSTEFDGPIPITFITPVGEDFSCSQGQIPEYHSVQSRDDAHCLVGYRCKES